MTNECNMNVYERLHMEIGACISGVLSEKRLTVKGRAALIELLKAADDTGTKIYDKADEVQREFSKLEMELDSVTKLAQQYGKDLQQTKKILDDVLKGVTARLINEGKLYG